MNQLPQFLEGERAVLGALILENEYFGRVQGILEPDDFHHPVHRAIYEAMMQLREKGEPIDLVTLTAALKPKGTAPINLLVSLVDEVPSAANVLHYARHIKDRSLKRRCIEVANEIAAYAQKPTCDANDLLTSFENHLTEIRSDYVAIHEDSLWRIKRDTESLLEIEEKILAKEIVEECLPSGFLDIDYYTGGFYAGNVVVICACSGMGKTALALDFSWYMAKEGHPALYCSFEMTRKEVARRIVAKECRVDILDLKRHTCTSQELQVVRKKMARLSDVPFLVDERNLIPAEIVGQIIRLNNRQPKHPIEVLCVDHIQLMGVRDQRQYQRRDLQLGSYMSELKDIAKQYNLVVLVLSQLNRRVAERGRSSHLPTRADIRDSGAIEENADVIIGVHREYEITKEVDDIHKADAVLIKNRDGRTGKIRLLWKPEWATFTNLDHIGRSEPPELINEEPTRTLVTEDGEYELF